MKTNICTSNDYQLLGSFTGFLDLKKGDYVTKDGVEYEVKARAWDIDTDTLTLYVKKNQ